VLILISSSLASEKFTNDSTTCDSISIFYEKGLQYYFINGISFALKTRSSYPHTWRLLFDLSGDYTTGSYEFREKRSSDFYEESERESDDHKFDIAISFQYNYFFKINDYFDPYVGIGPLIRYGIENQKYKSKEIIGGDMARSDETSSKYLGIGILSSIGIESRVMTHLSLFMELNLTYIYEWTKSESNISGYSSDDWRKYEFTGTSSSLNLDAIKLGLIVYF
jgi:hypothetical protein